MNKIIFANLFVDGKEISGHELGEAVRDVAEAERAVYRQGGMLASADSPHNASSPVLEDGAAWSGLTGADLLAVTLGGHGSSKTALVELRGFEPLTPSMRTRCATGLRYSPKTGSQRTKPQAHPAPAYSAPPGSALAGAERGPGPGRESATAPAAPARA